MDVKVMECLFIPFLSFLKREWRMLDTKFLIPVKGLSWIQHTIGYWDMKCSESGSRLSISN